MIVSSPAVEETLSRAEAALESGEGLAGTGFWGMVAEAKRQPELVDRYGDRIAMIDSRAHRDWAFLIVPLWLGTTLALIVTLLGLALIWWAYFLTDVAAIVAFFVGFGIVLVPTHGLAHLVVGRLVGIGFTYWFVGTIARPQPGVKVDYASYLRASPQGRAWMHASGAIVTKSLPFLLIGAAVAAGLPVWAAWALVVVGAASIVTDIVWSTKASDWKRFRREMAYAVDSSSVRGIDPSV